MKVAITSGKGGTGKTTVSTGIFQMLSERMDRSVQLLDCDVEEPNCQIFLNAKEKTRYHVGISIPSVNADACTFCGKCKDACQYNAIVMLPPVKYIDISQDMCHGCGVCSYVCPAGAIIEQQVSIGNVIHGRYGVENDFVEGRMKVGYSLQTRVIRETLTHAKQEGIILIDAPPGTSCPVVAAVSKADYVIMVTEPTPFGLHDLKLMTETVVQLGKKHGIIVNKSGLPYKPLYEYIHQNNMPVLGEIPFSKELAKAYSKGIIITQAGEEVKNIFSGIIDRLIHEEAL